MKSIELYIARDKDDTLTIFEEPPTKFGNSWIHRSQHQMFVDEDLFPEIKWEEEKPRKLVCTLK